MYGNSYYQQPNTVNYPALMAQLQQMEQAQQNYLNTLQQQRQIQQGNYGQSQQQGTQSPPSTEQPPQGTGIQVFSVDTQEEAENYPVEEGGLIILLQKDGSAIYAKKHNKSNWKTEFDVWDKRAKTGEQQQEENLAPSAIDIMQADIKEMKILLQGLINNDKNIDSTSTILEHVESDAPKSKRAKKQAETQET